MTSEPSQIPDGWLLILKMKMSCFGFMSEHSCIGVCKSLLGVCMCMCGEGSQLSQSIQNTHPSLCSLGGTKRPSCGQIDSIIFIEHQPGHPFEIQNCWWFCGKRRRKTVCVSLCVSVCDKTPKLCYNTNSNCSTVFHCILIYSPDCNVPTTNIFLPTCVCVFLLTLLLTLLLILSLGLQRLPVESQCFCT